MLFTLVWSFVERGWLSLGEMQPECRKRIRALCWQVLALPLSEEYARELRELDADERRLALTELWSGENARDVTIEKIRCVFFLEGARSDPIPEEGPLTPFTPEAGHKLNSRPPKSEASADETSTHNE
ncbi:MAG: hypothetical protein SGPRY_013419 [Prymnesium sp.]